MNRSLTTDEPRQRRSRSPGNRRLSVNASSAGVASPSGGRRGGNSVAPNERLPVSDTEVATAEWKGCKNNRLLKGKGYGLVSVGNRESQLYQCPLSKRKGLRAAVVVRTAHCCPNDAQRGRMLANNDRFRAVGIRGITVYCKIETNDDRIAMIRRWHSSSLASLYAKELPKTNDRLEHAFRVAKVLSKMEERGMAHGRIHLHNILSSSTGDLLLCDYYIGEPWLYGHLPQDFSYRYWIAPELALLDGDTDAEGEFVTSKKLSLADRYSFGILLLQLACKQPPKWHKCSRKEELHAEIGRSIQGLSNIQTFPSDLVRLITELLDDHPLKRPKFSSVYQRLYDILIELVIDDNVGKVFWQTSFPSMLHVKWPQFVAAAAENLNLKLEENQLPARMLLEVFRDISQQTEENPKKIIISATVFANLLEWIGPLHHDYELVGDQFMKNLADLLRKRWFHGYLTGSQASAKLANEKPGSFLVRFSGSDPGSFAISSKGRSGGPIHYRVYHKPGLDYLLGKVSSSSLQQVVFRFAKDLFLKSPCEGSRYRKLFEFTPKPATSKDRYTTFFCDEEEDGEEEDALRRIIDGSTLPARIGDPENIASSILSSTLSQPPSAEPVSLDPPLSPPEEGKCEESGAPDQVQVTSGVMSSGEDEIAQGVAEELTLAAALIKNAVDGDDGGGSLRSSLLSGAQ